MINPHLLLILGEDNVPGDSFWLLTIRLDFQESIFYPLDIQFIMLPADEIPERIHLLEQNDQGFALLWCKDREYFVKFSVNDKFGLKFQDDNDIG